MKRHNYLFLPWIITAATIPAQSTNDKHEVVALVRSFYREPSKSLHGSTFIPSTFTYIPKPLHERHVYYRKYLSERLTLSILYGIKRIGEDGKSDLAYFVRDDARFPMHGGSDYGFKRDRFWIHKIAPTWAEVKIKYSLEGDFFLTYFLIRTPSGWRIDNWNTIDTDLYGPFGGASPVTAPLVGIGSMATVAAYEEEDHPSPVPPRDPTEAEDPVRLVQALYAQPWSHLCWREGVTRETWRPKPDAMAKLPLYARFYTAPLVRSIATRIQHFKEPDYRSWREYDDRDSRYGVHYTGAGLEVRRIWLHRAKGHQAYVRVAYGPADNRPPEARTHKPKGPLFETLLEYQLARTPKGWRITDQTEAGVFGPKIRPGGEGSIGQWFYPAHEAEPLPPGLAEEPLP